MPMSNDNQERIGTRRFIVKKIENRMNPQIISLLTLNCARCSLISAPRDKPFLISTPREPIGIAVV